MTLPIWWRDDDAIDETAALDRLTRLSEHLCLPVHLAIIPAHAQPALANFIGHHSSLVPIVHGWSHENHANPEGKKAEFGNDRPVIDRLKDADRGLQKLRGLLNREPAPIFVPPWNRIAPDMFSGLSDLGFEAISTFTPRKSQYAATGLQQINTHLDPIDWRGTRSLVEPEQLVHQIARDLAHRRTKKTDNSEPYGILTHHLVHDQAIWSFTEALIERLLNGPARIWAVHELLETTKDKNL